MYCLKNGFCHEVRTYLSQIWYYLFLCLAIDRKLLTNEKGPKGQTMVSISLHRTLKIEQDESHYICHINTQNRNRHAKNPDQLH